MNTTNSDTNRSDGSGASKDRQRDKDGFRLRASCICVMAGDDNKVLLITSRRRKQMWVLPGGGIEPGEDGPKAAKREALEEAGVMGTITHYVGCFEDAIALHRTMVFILRVQEELGEWDEDGRRRQWFSLPEARELLNRSKPKLAQCLDALELAHTANDHTDYK